eukprot:11640682-Alexandrium_andersonii.AAC.1
MAHWPTTTGFLPESRPQYTHHLDETKQLSLPSTNLMTITHCNHSRGLLRIVPLLNPLTTTPSCEGE